MPTLNGRTLNASKNADGSVSLEFFIGLSTNRTVMTLSAVEATALGSVISGGTGTKSSAVHGNEKAALGEVDH